VVTGEGNITGTSDVELYSTVMGRDARQQQSSTGAQFDERGKAPKEEERGRGKVRRKRW